MEQILSRILEQSPTIGVLLLVLWRIDSRYLPVLQELRDVMGQVREHLRREIER